MASLWAEQAKSASIAFAGTGLSCKIYREAKLIMKFLTADN
jgi:hypothetical protein